MNSVYAVSNVNLFIMRMPKTNSQINVISYDFRNPQAYFRHALY